MYIAHFHYSDAIVFTAPYQKQRTDSCSHAPVSAMDLMSFVRGMNSPNRIHDQIHELRLVLMSLDNSSHFGALAAIYVTTLDRRETGQIDPTRKLQQQNI